MSRMKTILRNLRALVTEDFLGRGQALVDENARRVADHKRDLEARISNLDRRFEELGARVDARADAYEAAVDKRLDERLAAFEIRLGEYQAIVDLRIDERLALSEKTLDARFGENEVRVNTRADEFEAAITSRATSYESVTSQRQDTFEAALDERIASRLSALDESLEAHFQGVLKRVDAHFDERNRANDNRLDDRLARIERHIDSRFNTLEKRSDDRMETHERAVDGKLHQRSQDIVDRTDLMLQIFEHRLDKFRRQLREQGAGVAPGIPSGQISGSTASDFVTDETIKALSNGGSGEGEGNPSEQLISFRKLAQVGAQTLRKIGVGAPPLYHQILSWKKIAHEGLDEFAPDQQEIVDYLLSFVSEPKEVAYVKQHLRRFVSTLERVPALENPGDRLLELGSLGHLAPAVRKFCGYTEVFCADFWEGDDKVRVETLRQHNGSDSHSFELRNFNAEVDVFPYPDGYFRTVICCELIEHLQRDPLHMLWEINRVLGENGHLLLTTPNIASARAIEGLLVGCTPYLFPQYNLHEVLDQHNREYAPYEIGVALAAAGFSVVELETEDVWKRSNPAIIELLKEIQISPELRGDNIFALARKVSAPIERHPIELYTD